MYTTLGVTAQWALHRDVSDSCTIILKIGNQNWGAQPFRFNNCWLSYSGFKNVIEDCWRGMSIEGWGAFILKEKLKGLKSVLKEWNSEIFDCINVKIKEIEN